MPELEKATVAPDWKWEPVIVTAFPDAPWPVEVGDGVIPDGLADVTVKQPEQTPVPSMFETRTSQAPMAAGPPPEPVARLKVAVAVVPEILPVTDVPVISDCPALWRTAEVGAVMPVPVKVSGIAALVFSPVGGATAATVGAAANAGTAPIPMTRAVRAIAAIPLRTRLFIAASFAHAGDATM
ncbi:MAG: hypothetical protein E6H53_17630 [Betaproteobacteria bacterium]|nr:MAG: hypothetical protein E6H53_17630 [Betaproteobacteria bacterium]